jgi:peptidyl-prolyl cis-trans isomerase SurA
MLTVGLTLGAMAQTSAPDSSITPTEPLAASPVLIDRIVAIVDEEPVLLSELEREIESYRFEAESRGLSVDEEPAALRQRMLERLIEVKLLVAQAKVDGIQMPEEELERLVGEDLQKLIDRFGNRSELERALANEGMTFDDLRARQRELNRNKFYTQRMVDMHIRRKIDISAADVRAYYDEHKSEIPARPDTVCVGNILVVPQLAQDRQTEMLDRLTAIQTALRDGMSFEDAAIQFSEDPNAAQGGYLGRWKRGDLFSPVLEEAAWSIEVGAVSQPLQTDRGVHVLKVISRDESEVELSQIMLRIELGAEELAAAEQRATQVAQLARDGTDFGQLARSYSDDPGSRERGGEIGCYPTDQLNPLFAQSLQNVAVGATVGPVRGEAGWFVLRLNDRKPGASLAYDDIKARLEAMLFDERVEGELGAFLKGLRDKFYVEMKA